jgi:hypothetical protein
MSRQTIGGVTATVCQLMGVSVPDGPIERPYAQVLDRAREINMGRCERVLLYAPDAIGFHLNHAHPEIISPVKAEAPVVVNVRAEMPSVTPVCFATMFTGLPPTGHGIRRYEKPVLKCDTLFDRLLASGRKVAIVAIENASMDRIFRGRELDYFTVCDDTEVTETTLRLIKADAHDLILAYHCEYDDMVHRTTPRSPEAIQALRNHVSSFLQLAHAVHGHWRARDRMIAFLPDHGAHLDSETGKGTHGLDVPEDMDVQHFFGLYLGGTD